MRSTKYLFLATTALFGGLLLGGEALAQSTASQQIEADTATEVGEVIITGTRAQRSISGVVQAETAPKARTSIGQEYIATQPAGQTIFQSLNQTPGLNFTNNDPYGSSGGNVRLRGQDGNRVALLWDGIPLNDTGNYATFTNQLLDPEIVSQVNVNTGTADVDSPSPAAVGGTINYTTLLPDEAFGAWVQPSVGSWDFRRVIGRVDSGALGPFDTRGFLSASYTEYDKYRGPGGLEKQQVNGYVYQELREEDFIGIGVHYNENRNNFYRNLSLADYYRTDGSLDNDQRCIRVAGVNGTAQNESTQNSVVTSQGDTVNNTSCTNYFELRNNPSNTGNIRGQSAFRLTEQLRLTFDPYFQYTLANGGGFTVVSETDGRLRGSGTGAGADLNGDTDLRDQVTLYTPNTTNTRRYGFTSSLLYDLTDNHSFRVAYTVDYGRHRQTGEATFVDANGKPGDVFGGKDGYGERVRAPDGSFYRGRDRFSIASLQQVAAQYRGRLLDDRVVLDVGVRAPFFKRDLNQYCFTQNGSSNVRCTTETATPLANGNVTFAGVGTTATVGGVSTFTPTQFIRPYETEYEYDDILPNVGASYEFLDNNVVFASFAEGFAAPRTDNLYAAFRNPRTGEVLFADPEPEESVNYDLGYRYSTPNLLVYGTLFHNEFTNRIVSSFDQDLGFNVDRNVGAVHFTGLDFQIGYDPIEQLTLSTFVSYIDAELQDNTPTNVAGGVTLTEGKKLVEVPEISFGGRVTFRPIEDLSLGLQTKYVDSRFSNDLNTESAPDYTVWDLDANYNLARFGYEDAFVQLNVTNLFNEDYLGSISSAFAAGTGTFAVGAPTTVQLSIRAGF